MRNARHVLWVWFKKWKMQQQIQRGVVDCSVAFDGMTRAASRASLAMQQFAEAFARVESEETR